MHRKNVRWFAAVAVVALVASGIAWASDSPRPDSVAEDKAKFRVLTLDRKGGPPGPVTIPGPPIAIKPIGDPIGGSGFAGFAAGISAPVGGGGGSTTVQIERSLKSVAEKLR